MLQTHSKAKGNVRKEPAEPQELDHLMTGAKLLGGEEESDMTVLKQLVGEVSNFTGENQLGGEESDTSASSTSSSDPPSVECKYDRYL